MCRVTNPAFSMLSLDDLINSIEGNEFDEIPVSIEEFVTGEDYLNLPSPLSEYQYQLIKASSQIYKRDTLHHLYGFEAGEKRWKQTCNEVIFVLGKGNIDIDQKVYSPEYGYVAARDLMGDAWMADSRHGANVAVPFYDEGEDDVYRITTQHGYTLDCGPNHRTPVWKNTKHFKNYTMSKQQFDLPTSALSKGDIVEIKRGWTEPTNPYSVTSDEARLIGYMIGDGTFVRVSHRRNGIDYRNATFTNATPEVQEDFCRIIRGMGGTTSEPFLSGKGCWSVRVNGLTRRFVELGLVQEYHENKPWNDEWLRMSNSDMIELLTGCWATDGWFSFVEPGKKIGPRYTKTTSAVAGIEMVTESCIKGIHLALLKVGIISKYSKHRNSRNDGKHQATYRVQITDSQMTREFARKIATIPGKQTQLDRCMNLVTTTRKVNDRGDRIASIEYIGKKRTVGTTVEVESNFNAGGIITCNSGKDYSSTIACSYIVYLLLCLKDPAAYYGKPPGDTIDILNIAINAQQANNVFFKGFKNRITRSPWFQGKYTMKAGQIEFDKNINVYSGHSEREAYEGYNVIYVVLDEISGFALDSTSGNEQSKTAQATYDMYSASVTSRFPDFGKIVLLSFPRFKADFISQRYDAVVAEKDTVMRTHTFKLDPDVQDGVEGNEFNIEWEEDHILRYTTPRVYALKRPTWEVNPTKKIEDFTRAFFDNPVDALSRFACMPPESISGLFKDRQKIETAFTAANGVDEEGVFYDDFLPDDTKSYFVHVDLALKHDHCAVSLAHVDKWTTRMIAGQETKPAPHVVVDAVRWWTPTTDKNVDFAEVRDYIVSLNRRGFKIKLVTFDRWRSDDMIDYLRTVGMRAEVLSVGNPHYTDLVMVISEERLTGPNIPLLKEELLQLRIMPNGKIDHPRTGSKDLADATCGAVYNAIAHTPRDMMEEIEIVTASTFNRKPERPKGPGFDGVIRPPRSSEPMPPELSDFLSQIRVIGS